MPGISDESLNLRLNRTTRASRTVAEDAIATTFRTTDDVVFVDVGERVIEPSIVRDGINVGVFEIDDTILDDIIVGRAPIVQRVIRQSVAPGTPVPIGTAVNLVMAPTRNLPAGVINGALLALAQEPLGNIYESFVRDNPATSRILGKVGPGNTLPPTETTQLRELFESQGVTLDDQSGNDVSAAIETLRAAYTFGS